MRLDLVERARQGDRDAFGQLILRDPDLAEDAVQEALVRCWRQLPKLRDIERFDGWLYRILVRAALDEFGRRRRFDASVQALPSEPGTGDAAAGLADRDLLERGFRHLSVEHRAVVVLHHYVGLPLPEVARTLGIPPGTAKSRYHYAMSALRSILEAEGRIGHPEGALA
jgi:RNA polymerase sigma-70 factor, ECF subfamily